MSIFNGINNPGVDLNQLTYGEVSFISGLSNLSYEQGDVLYYNGTALTVLHHGTSGQVLQSGGHAANPSWVTTGAGTGDVIAPAANTADYIPQWNGANSKTLKDGLAVPAGGLAGLTALGNKLDSSSFSDAGVTGKLITGFTSGAGSVAATDTILQAINKLDGNVAAKQPQLNGTGFVKASGTTISYDNSTYLTAVTAHNLLSTTHGDTTADTVVRGDIITGQGATPTWTRLAFPGTPTGKVLIASATDVIWSSSALGTAAYAATGDFLALHGKADTAGNADTVTTNANLTGVVTSSGNATSVASGAIKANMLQTTATDLGASDVTINLGNTNGSYVTNITTDGSVTATGGFVGALTGTASGNLTSGGALGTPSSGTLSSCSGLPISGLTASTSTALGVGSIELGHASDTTIARVSAGVVSIENINIMTVGSTDTVTGVKTLGTTGAIKLGSAITDKCEIRLNDSALNDETWSGTVLDAVAGATLAVGDVCYLKTADGQWYLNDGILDGTDAGFKLKLGICVLAANDNGATKMLLDGLIASAAFPTFTVGAPVYLDDTAGDLVVAQPTTTNFAIRVVGEAVSATVLHFHPSNDYIVHV